MGKGFYGDEIANLTFASLSQRVSEAFRVINGETLDKAGKPMPKLDGESEFDEWLTQLEKSYVAGFERGVAVGKSKSTRRS